MVGQLTEQKSKMGNSSLGIRGDKPERFTGIGRKAVLHGDLMIISVQPNET
jgi:hypothetical protein